MNSGLFLLSLRVFLSLALWLPSVLVGPGVAEAQPLAASVVKGLPLAAQQPVEERGQPQSGELSLPLVEGGGDESFVGEGLMVHLAVQPSPLPPQAPVTWQVHVRNDSDDLMAGVVAQVELPAELTFLASEEFEPQPGQPESLRLTWPLPDLYAGEEAFGWFQTYLTSGVRPAGPISVTVALSGPGVYGQLQDTAAVAWLTTPPDLITVAAGQAGVLVSGNGRLRLAVPAGAVGETVQFAHVPVTSGVDLGAPYQFHLSARRMATGEPVLGFSRPLTLTVVARAAGPARQPRLFHFDAGWGIWTPVPVTWDEAAGVVRGSLTELGLYQVMASSEETPPGFQWLPTTRGIAADLWTGNLTLSYPLALPAGMRELLALSLSYSTELINGYRAIFDPNGDDEKPMEHFFQASPYGLGWDLAGLGRITMSIAARDDPNPDDRNKAILSFAGGTYELVADSEGGNRWTTKPQAFLRIYHEGDYTNQKPWYVWTPDGTRYTFGNPSGGWGQGNIYWWRHLSQRTRQALLTRVRDPHGNEIRISWTTDEEGTVPAGCQGEEQQYRRSAIPQFINYVSYAPAGQPRPAVAQVQLLWNSDRQDTDLRDAGSCDQPLWTDRRIRLFQVKVKENGAWQKAREYKLVHGYHQGNETWRQHLVLEELKPKGRDGTVLVTNSFSYTTGDLPGDYIKINHLRLSQVDNGYGGVVEVSYADKDVYVHGSSCESTKRLRPKRFVVATLRYYWAGDQYVGSRNYAYYKNDRQQEHDLLAWVKYLTCDTSYEYLGADRVEEVVKDAADEELGKTVAYFLQIDKWGADEDQRQPHPGRGRLRERRVSDGSYGDLLQVRYRYVIDEGDPSWARLEEEKHTRFDGPGQPNGKQYLIAYQYRIDHQTRNGNSNHPHPRQYGNWTHRQEAVVETVGSSVVTTTLRTTERWFSPRDQGSTPNGIRYVTALPSHSKLWEGEGGAVCRGESQFIYDNNGHYSWAPDKGLLTEERHAQTNCGGSSWAITSYTYTGSGRLQSRTDPNGHTTTYSYEFYDLYLDTVSNERFQESDTDWDHVIGQPTRVTGPNGEVTDYAYDVFGRLIQVWRPGDSRDAGHAATETYSYDYLSNDKVFRVVHGVRGGSDDGGSGTANYIRRATFYDGLGRAIQVREQGRNTNQPMVTNMAYDVLGRKTWMSDPDMGQWEYRYDDSGNLIKQRDARNQAICFYYDELNRLLGKSYHSNVADLDTLSCPGPGEVIYTYDQGANGLGRLSRVDDGSGWISYDYDERGRVITETHQIAGEGGGTFVLGFGYNDSDQVRRLTYPDGEAVDISYHNDGLVQRVIGDSPYLTETRYNARRQPTCYRFGGWTPVIQTLLFYNDSGDLRLSGLTSGAPGSTACAAPSGDALQNLSYSYDEAGNVVSISDLKAGSQTQSFSYDELDRVVSATVSGGSGGVYTESYEYYANGNLKRKGPAAQGSYAYDNAAHRHAVTGLSNGDFFVYDSNGNMIYRQQGGVSYSQVWDAENRLVQVTWLGGSAEFVYDAEGNRVKATVNGETTVYVGRYYEQTGTASTRYYYAGGRRIALRRSGYASDNGVFYLLPDHLGSTHVTAGGGGGKQGELRYKAWGETRYSWGSTPTTYRFTGQREDGTIGLYFYKARYYDPVIGRFVQPDTIVPEPGNPQDLNRYSYVANNPLKFTDPSGHAMCIDDRCDLVWHPVSQRPVLRIPAPRIIMFTYGEMTRNAQGPLAWIMSQANTAAGQYFHKAEFSRALGAKALALGLWTSQVMDARVKNYVGPLAPLLGNWDHKPLLMDEKRSPVPEIPSERPGKPRGWSAVGSRLHRFDIWSNIHYGYIGRASGFSQSELTGGAGIEQIGSDLYNKAVPHRSPGADNWAASWDDPSDNAAIQIGIQLWNQYGLAVKPADLYLAVLEEPRLATQPLGGAP